MSSESWKTTFEIIGLLLLALTFIDAYFVWHFANKVSEEQKEQLRAFDSNLTAAKKDLAEQQRETADAQLALRKYIDGVNAARGPRVIVDNKAFVAALQGKPKAKAEIWFAPNSEEAYTFATQIQRWLGPGVAGDGAGWQVSEPIPIPNGRGDPRISQYAPPAIRYGARGLTIAANRLWKPSEKDTALQALMGAFFTVSPPQVPSGESIPTLSDGLVIIIVSETR